MQGIVYKINGGETMEEKAYYEVNLPKFLENDLNAYKKGIEENSTLLDCLWGEVYGSINSAYYDGSISEEQAAYLREKYLF